MKIDNISSNNHRNKTKVKKEEEESPNRDTDDWDTMYNESGECLDPNPIDDLTSAVNKVSLDEKPKFDFKLYEEKLATLNEEEYPHVLEVSNFPTEFKTQDVMQIFADQKEKGFEIKWIDDTHALAVFSSARVGEKYLFVKTVSSTLFFNVFFLLN